jgi:UDP-N-acetylmuramoyl-L-alanyl-D-glutamate--2,6-diaminopimelate ligase
VADHRGCTFTLNYGDQAMPVTLPLVGEFNIANALCAIGVSHAAGVPLELAVDALARVPGVSGRMQRIDEGQPFGVVVDYAHTPASLEKILTLLRGLVNDRQVIVVSGSAGERDATKRPLQGRVMADLADVVIITSEDPRNEDPLAIIAEIAAGAKSGRGRVYQIDDRREAIALAFASAHPGDIVLLAGKGHETSIIRGFDHHPWDEAAVARSLLQPYRKPSG